MRVRMAWRGYVAGTEGGYVEFDFPRMYSWKFGELKKGEGTAPVSTTMSSTSAWVCAAKQR